MALQSAVKVVRRRPLTAAVRRFVLSRRVVQSAVVLSLIAMPLLDIFRIDAATYRVIFFWQTLPMVSLALIAPVLFILPLAVFFMLASRFGRLFCSWACPQGALNEAATKSQLEIWGRRKPWDNSFALRFPRAGKRRIHWWLRRGRAWWMAVARYSLRILIVPALAAFAGVSYFVAPDQLWAMLAGGQFGQPAVLALIGVYGMICADLVFLQELSCRVCFFGYLQSVVAYSQQTGVRRDDALKSACNGCSGCRDSCFAGVDPRTRIWQQRGGTQLSFDQCVSCGDCLVACDDLTSRRGVPLIMQMPPVVKRQ